MAQFKTDLRDVYFNLFQMLKIQERSELGENDLKDIINEYNKFTEKEIYPCRLLGDQQGVHMKDGKVTIPSSFHAPMKKFYENGWYGIGYPEEIGGMPAPHSISLLCQSIMNGAN